MRISALIKNIKIIVFLSLFFFNNGSVFALQTPSTLPADSIGERTATLHGSITAVDQLNNAKYFFEWGEQADSLDNLGCLYFSVPTTGLLNCQINNLTPDTSYFYRVVVQDNPVDSAPIQSRGAVMGFRTLATGSGSFGTEGSKAGEGSAGGTGSAVGGSGSTGVGTATGTSGSSGTGGAGRGSGAFGSFGADAGEGSDGGTGSAVGGSGSTGGTGASGGTGSTGGAGSSAGRGAGEISGGSSGSGGLGDGGVGGDSGNGLVPCGTQRDSQTGLVTNPCKFSDLEILFERVMNFLLFTVLIPLATIAIVFVGIQFVTAAGNPSKLDKAKSALWYVLIGIFIALAAWLIINTIFTVLTTRGGLSGYPIAG